MSEWRAEFMGYDGDKFIFQSLVLAQLAPQVKDDEKDEKSDEEDLDNWGYDPYHGL
jgi:hypothetical protein